MKKFSVIFLLAFLLSGCGENSSISSEVASSYESSSSSSEVISSSSISSSSEDLSLSEEIKKCTLQEINEMGNALNNDEQGNKVLFEARYVKLMTDNFDKLMLFVDDTDYVYVRVNYSDFNDYLKNRYTDCLYLVEGYITKVYDHVEVNYVSLSNITIDKEKANYDNIVDYKNSINEVFDEFKLLSLNKKNNALGKIVAVEGTIISTEYTDSNKKIVIYDGMNVLTIVNDERIVMKEDIGKKYSFIGALSVLKGSPALWFLDKNYIDNEDVEFFSAIEVQPSYFAQWYNVSDRINNPSFDDFSKLYKVSGYVQINNDITTSYNFGLVDNENDSLSDVGEKKSIKGIFLMNHLSLSDKDIAYSKFAQLYESGEKVSVYVSLHQFDTNNHGWKVFPVE